MPDISMCMNEECPKREKCYRFKAEPGYYQSYSDFQNRCNKENDYKFFWKLEKVKK